MSKIQIPKRELARIAGTDAANRSMREAGRKTWSKEDYNAAVREYNRICKDN